jgi:hypothetical protein
MNTSVSWGTLSGKTLKFDEEMIRNGKAIRHGHVFVTKIQVQKRPYNLNMNVFNEKAMALFPNGMLNSLIM